MIFLIGGFTGLIAWILFNWRCNVYSNRPYIKFEQFVDLYNKSPDKWELYNGYVSYHKDNCYIYSKAFNFNLIDHYLYQHWRRKTLKQQLNQEVEDLIKEINEK